MVGSNPRIGEVGEGVGLNPLLPLNSRASDYFFQSSVFKVIIKKYFLKIVMTFSLETPAQLGGGDLASLKDVENSLKSKSHQKTRHSLIKVKHFVLRDFSTSF